MHRKCDFPRSTAEAESSYNSQVYVLFFCSLLPFLCQCDYKEKRSTEGCSKFKSPETRQVQERFVSTLDHNISMSFYINYMSSISNLISII